MLRRVTAVDDVGRAPLDYVIWRLERGRGAFKLELELRLRGSGACDEYGKRESHGFLNMHKELRLSENKNPLPGMS